MISALLVALAAAAPPVARPGAPAAPEATVEVPCPEPGAAQAYQLDKRSVVEQGGRREVRTLRAQVQLSGASRDDGRSVFDVRVTDLVTTGALELGDQLATRAMAEPFRIELRPDRTVHLAEPDAMVARYVAAGEDVRRSLQAARPDLAAQAAAWLDAVVTDPQVVAERTLVDLRPLFAFTCGPVPMGEVRYETALANPLGGAALPALGVVQGTVVAEVLRVEVTERLDPVRVADALGPVLAELGAPAAGARLEDLKLEMDTSLTVEIERATGWPTRWSSERRGSVMGRGRVDSATMEGKPRVVVPPDPER